MSNFEFPEFPIYEMHCYNCQYQTDTIKSGDDDDFRCPICNICDWFYTLKWEVK